MNLSFAGCGFYGMYHLGVISCLQKHGKSLMQEVNRFGGASAGSLAAALLATSTPLEQGVSFTTELASNVRKKFLGAFNPSFDLTEHLNEGLQSLLPPDAHKLANEKLFVSITKYPQYKNAIISEFDTRDDLIQALLASCYIPIYGGSQVPFYKGEKWFDGGFTDNLPVFETGKTICVSPFSGDFDICPEDENSTKLLVAKVGKNMNIAVNFQNIERGIYALFPPSEKTLQSIYKNGYDDALKFLRVHVR